VDDFQCFFEAKVKSVRGLTAGYAQTGGTTTSRQDAGSSQPSMTTMQAVSAEDVRCIILAASAKSCSLDPILTQLLCDCIDALFAFLNGDGQCIIA